MSRDVPRSNFPSFKRRIGDAMLANSSNAAVIIGRDRSREGERDHSSDPGSGAISVVVGRATEGLDLERDRASIYISAITDIDSVLPDNTSVTVEAGSAIAAVADSVRIRARNGLRIVIGSASITIGSDGLTVIEGDIRIGKDAVQRAILGETLVDALLNHVHISPSTGGPTSTMQPVVPRETLLAKNTRIS